MVMNGLESASLSHRGGDCDFKRDEENDNDGQAVSSLLQLRELRTWQTSERICKLKVRMSRKSSDEWRRRQPYRRPIPCPV